MICLKCGMKNVEGAKFCGGCGEKLAAWVPQEPTQEVPQQGVPQEEILQETTQETLQEPEYELEQWPSRPAGAAKKNPLRVVIPLLIVIAAAGIGGFFAYRHFFKDKQPDAATASSSSAAAGEAETLTPDEPELLTPVRFHISDEAYDEETATPLAIRVVGTDLAGNPVEQEVLIGGGQPMELNLPAGEYTVEVAATPILADGTMYRKPTALVAVSVPRSSADVVAGEPVQETAASSAGATDQQTTSSAGTESQQTAPEPVAVEIELTPIEDVQELTEEEIRENTQTLIDFGYEETKAEEFRQKATEKREEMQAVWEEEHREYVAEVTINAPGYDPASSSPIPVHLIGEDFESSKVDEKFLVGSEESPDISLRRGNYTLEVIAPPILADGSTFAEAESAINIVVEREDGQEVNDVHVEAAIDLVPITPASSVTEEQLQKSFDALVECGYDKAKAAAFLAAALAKKDTITEEDLCAAFQSAVSETIQYFAFDDFDGDGRPEAIVAAEDVDSKINTNIYYVASDGNVSFLQDGCIGFEFIGAEYYEERGLIRAGEQKFFVWENYAGGSGSHSRIFGVRNGQGYQPDPSGGCQMFQMQDGEYCSFESDFSPGFHDHYKVTYSFDPTTGNFVPNG